MKDDFRNELKKLKESDSSQSYDIKEQDWEAERKMLMGLIEKNQQYAYNAQEKLKSEKEQYENDISQIKQDLNNKISELETENSELKQLLDKVQIKEEGKGNEVKMVRANLIEEIFRVQNIHQKNEDDLRKDNDLLAAKYSEGIQSFKDTLKKAEEDNNMLRKKIDQIISENKSTEADLIAQINELNRTNSKLTKSMEVQHKEFMTRTKTADSTRRSELYSSFEKEDIENYDASVEQVITCTDKTVKSYEKQLKDRKVKWKKEKEKFLNEIETRENIYAEKLALRDMELERIKSTYDRQRKLEETKNQTLAKENKILDKSLKGKFIISVRDN